MKFTVKEIAFLFLFSLYFYLHVLTWYGVHLEQYFQLQWSEYIDHNSIMYIMLICMFITYKLKVYSIWKISGLYLLIQLTWVH